ncbi:hypothetical protein PCE1_001319 [Barthelona sp. PCE]
MSTVLDISVLRGFCQSKNVFKDISQFISVIVPFLSVNDEKIYASLLNLLERGLKQSVNNPNTVEELGEFFDVLLDYLLEFSEGKSLNIGFKVVEHALKSGITDTQCKRILCLLLSFSSEFTLNVGFTFADMAVQRNLPTDICHRFLKSLPFEDKKFVSRLVQIKYSSEEIATEFFDEYFCIDHHSRIDKLVPELTALMLENGSPFAWKIYLSKLKDANIKLTLTGSSNKKVSLNVFQEFCSFLKVASDAEDIVRLLRFIIDLGILTPAGKRARVERDILFQFFMVSLESNLMNEDLFDVFLNLLGQKLFVFIKDMVVDTRLIFILVRYLLNTNQIMLLFSEPLVQYFTIENISKELVELLKSNVSQMNVLTLIRVFQRLLKIEAHISLFECFCFGITKKHLLSAKFKQFLNDNEFEGSFLFALIKKTIKFDQIVEEVFSGIGSDFQIHEYFLLSHCKKDHSSTYYFNVMVLLFQLQLINKERFCFIMGAIEVSIQQKLLSALRNAVPIPEHWVQTAFETMRVIEEKKDVNELISDLETMLFGRQAVLVNIFEGITRLKNKEQYEALFRLFMILRENVSIQRIQQRDHETFVEDLESIGISEEQYMKTHAHVRTRIFEISLSDNQTARIIAALDDLNGDIGMSVLCDQIKQLLFETESEMDGSTVFDEYISKGDIDPSTLSLLLSLPSVMTRVAYKVLVDLKPYITAIVSAPELPSIAWRYSHPQLLHSLVLLEDEVSILSNLYAAHSRNAFFVKTLAKNAVHVIRSHDIFLIKTVLSFFTNNGLNLYPLMGNGVLEALMDGVTCANCETLQCIIECITVVFHNDKFHIANFGSVLAIIIGKAFSACFDHPQLFLHASLLFETMCRDNNSLRVYSWTSIVLPVLDKLELVKAMSDDHKHNLICCLHLLKDNFTAQQKRYVQTLIPSSKPQFKNFDDMLAI